MTEFIKEYLSEILAILALVVSLVASSRSYSADKRSINIQRQLDNEKHLTRRTNLILESEKNNALVGKLLLIMVKNTLLLKEHPSLLADSHAEIDRLKNAIDILNSLKLADQERLLVEHDSIGQNLKSYHTSLEKVNQLTIRLEAEYEKEKYLYEDLLSIKDKNFA